MQTMTNPESSDDLTADIAGFTASPVELEATSPTISEEPPADHDLFSSGHSASAQHSATGSRVVCYVDRVTSDGYVEGWARDESENRPCILQMLQDGIVIAETVADSFRQDLLDAGIGHGHYAFYSRITGAKPGECDLEVVDKRSGAVISVTGPKRHFIPVIERSRPASVHDLLRRRRWTASHLARNIECLQLSQNMRIMGVYRFVDVTFMFLLNRWMDETGLRHVEQLESGETSPEQFFCELAVSEQRLAAPHVLAGPYDGKFPFKIFPSHRRLSEPA